MDNATKICILVCLMALVIIIVKSVVDDTNVKIMIISAALLVGGIYLKNVTNWKWLMWVCIISSVVLIASIIYKVSKIRIKTIHIAKFIGIYQKKTRIYHKGLSGYASYNSNTGKISYISGTPDTWEDEYTYYAQCQLPGGKIIEFDINDYSPPSSFYQSNEYSREVLCESGNNKTGTVKYTETGRFHFNEWVNQKEAKKEFDELDINANGKNDKVKNIQNKLISWQLLGFLSVILINTLSVFILRICHYFNTSYNDVIAGLPADGFYLFILLVLFMILSFIAPFIAVPIALHKLYSEFETKKVFLSALIGFPVCYMFCALIENAFNKSGVLLYSTQFGIFSNLAIIGSFVVTYISFLVRILIRFFKELYNNSFYKK